MMKKLVSVLLTAAMAATMMMGCGGSTGTSDASVSSEQWKARLPIAQMNQMHRLARMR
jgi:hypothetical protein